MSGPCQPTAAKRCRAPAGEGGQPGLALTLPQHCGHRWLLRPFSTPSHSINKTPSFPPPEPFLGQPHLSFRPLRGSPFLPSGQRQHRLRGPGGQPAAVPCLRPACLRAGREAAARGEAEPVPPPRANAGARPGQRGGSPCPARPPLVSPAAPRVCPAGPCPCPRARPAPGRPSAGTAPGSSSTADPGCFTRSPRRNRRLDLTSCLRDTDQYFILPGDRQPEKCEHTPLFE